MKLAYETAATSEDTTSINDTVGILTDWAAIYEQEGDLTRSGEC